MIGEDDGRDGWEEQGTDASHKPQRLQETMASYLISLEQQVSSFGVDEEAEDTLMDNMLMEIKSCTASAACDRRTNVIIEKLCINANLANVLELLKRFSDYSVFLARNRHSSHVLQALLARLSSLLKNYHVEGTEEEAPLLEAFRAFAQPVLADISWLVKDMSASHVLRAIFCVLGGIPVISEYKGKGSKHKHSVPGSESLESLLASSTYSFYISSASTFYVPPAFHDLMRKASEIFTALSTEELQDLVADQGAAACMALLLRILMGRIVRDGPEVGEKLIRQALNWGADGGDVTGAPVFYGMSADKAGSYFLESCIECGPVALLQSFCKHAVLGRVREYAEDSTANFVLQAILRRSAAVITKAHAEPVISGDSADDLLRVGGKRYRKVQDVCSSILEELLEREVFAQIVARCAGVVLWMINLARTMSNSEEMKHWDEKVAQKLLDTWADNHSVEANTRGLQSIFASQFSPKVGKNDTEVNEDANEGAVKATHSKKPKFSRAIAAAESRKDHDSRQLLWARLVGAVLQSKTNAAASLCTALSQLPQETLFHMSTSGPISRSVMDVLLDTANVECISSMLETLQPCITQLASNFLGQHMIRRIFERASTDDKIALANLLQCDMKILQKTKEGRASLKICQIDLLSRKPEEWHRMILRQARGAEMLSELANSANTTAKQSSSVHSIHAAGEDPPQEKQKDQYRQHVGGHRQSDATAGWTVEGPSGDAEKTKRKRKADSGARRDGRSKETKFSDKADFEKISRLRGANLGLNLRDEVEKMERERYNKK